jgi:4'-phosphopantetheinyl transferase
MIKWLDQEYADEPGLELGLPPPGLLSPTEWRQFSTLRVEKRRREWLLGRWTAKRLLLSIIATETGNMLSPVSLAIGNDEQGAPQFSGVHGLEDLSKSLCLSISHARGRALCAAGKVSHLGADVEWIETRPSGFAAEYLTRNEMECLAGVSHEMEDTLLTAIWSGKEAVLKALRMGLTVDTRAVSCQVSSSATPPFRMKKIPDLWSSFEIQLDPRRLGWDKSWNTPELCGWWQVADGYIYTLVFTRGETMSRLVL